jgi:hypothetical protein
MVFGSLRDYIYGKKEMTHTSRYYTFLIEGFQILLSKKQKVVCILEKRLLFSFHEKNHLVGLKKYS